MISLKLRLSLFAGALLITSIPAVEAVGFNGELVANNSCPLYMSKNNLTNPDNLYTQVGNHYAIKEANKIPASWYRVVVPGVSSSNNLRWVEAGCGFADGNVIENGDNNNNQGSCLLNSGKADGYVLALSLQPAFCETTGYGKQKPECMNLTNNSPYMKQLSLHGLWPNQDACGTNYGYCDNTIKQSAHCDYQPLDFKNQQVSELLKQYMPSYHYGSCLERHEWYKHGSCQARSVDDYYDLALNLTQQVNKASFNFYIASHLGQTITVTELNQQFEISFGIGSSKKIKPVCSKSLLVDIYMELPNLDKNHDTQLPTLLSLAKDAGKSNCGTQFKISNFSTN